MPKIGDPFDEVSGEIFGGNYGAAWVTYDGRKQGKTIFASDMQGADKILFSFIDELKQDLGVNFKNIFPDQLWVFHYDGI